LILKSENFKKISLLERKRTILKEENLVKPLEELAKDENPKIRKLAKWLLETEKKMRTYIFASMWFFYPVDVVFEYSREFKFAFALVTTKDFEIELVKLCDDPIEFIERVKKLNIPYDSKLFLIEACVNRDILQEIVEKYENKLDILLAIAKDIFLHYSWEEQREELDTKIKLESKNPAIKLLSAYANGENPSKEVIKACIERFRKEKNENNKHALFYLLFHFLNPFKV